MSSSPDPQVCRKEEAVASPPSLFQNGNIVFQAHHVGWVIAGCFTIIATVTSIWLVNKHLQWYTDKREQRYIVRILFMVPLYAIISLASYLWWNHATPLILVRDGYESTVLTAFFYLLLMYMSHNPEDQRRIFMKSGLSRQNDAERMQRGEPLQKWVFPLGFVKWKPADGLYFLQLMKWGVLQYCVIRPVTTFIAVILDYMGLYCESSWGLGWGHVYITIVVSLSVTIAMYCLIQLYVSVSKDLAKHKPLLKLFAIKAVVFLTFWQATFLSILGMFGVVKDTQYMTAEDINIGIGALVETFEMTLFAFLHIRAFTYKAYRPFYDPSADLPPPERTPRLKSLGHAMDFRETFRELWIGCIYMWAKFRGKQPAPDIQPLRIAHYEGAFGKQRPSQILPTFQSGGGETPRPTLPQVQVEIDEHIEVDIAGEKQWLGLGDNYGYGLKFLRKERSEGLEAQIEQELEKRGYTLRDRNPDAQHSKHAKQRSWWRSIYHRISQTGHEPEDGTRAPEPPNHWQNRARSRSRSRRPSRDSDAERRLLVHADIDLEDRPPPSIIRKNQRELRTSVDKWRHTVGSALETEDVLMPLSGYAEHRRVHRHHTEQPPVPMVTSPVIVGPREITSLRSPDGQLSRIFPPAENDLWTESGHTIDGGQSLFSSAEGYKLAGSTPPTRFVSSQPAIIPANHLGMAGERRSTLYHLADGYNHIPMTADVFDIGSDGNVEAAKPVSSVRVHRRESASYNRSRNLSPTPDASAIPEAGPSTPFTRSAVDLRRGSAQYYPSKPTSHRTTSLALTTDMAHPRLPQTTPSKRQPHRSSAPRHNLSAEESNTTSAVHNPLRASMSLPPNHDQHMTYSPTSVDDGLSCYPAHFSPTHYKIPRQ